MLHLRRLSPVLLAPLTAFVLAAPGLARQAPDAPRLATRWTATVDPRAPWPEYPRPSLARTEWSNLNGTWECALPKADDARSPSKLEFDQIGRAHV
jgi:hypothetical protein